MKEIIKELRDINIKSISEKQLEDLLPTLGMNGENLSEMPVELSEYYDKGIKFWQYPNQFSKYLKHISNYDIKSYLEIGCRWGGTFIITTEILRKRHVDLAATACDLMPMSHILNGYHQYNYFQYLEGDSAFINRVATKGDVDLILIDGDHSYEGVMRDYNNCLSLNPKYLVFHDIVNDACPGTVSFWKEIKEQYTHYEFIDQYESVKGSYLGIGLIEI